MAKINCEECGKTLKTAQALAGHLRFVHKTKPNKETELSHSQEYPFSQPIYQSWALAGCHAGFADTPEKFIEKITLANKLMLQEDPAFFQRCMVGENQTVEDVFKQFWFFQKVGMVADFGDFFKKARALSTLRSTVIPF